MTEALPSFTCPRCGRTSYHPKDAEHGYCGACHEFTAPLFGVPQPVWDLLEEGITLERGTGGLRFNDPSFGQLRCEECGEMTDHNTAWHRQHGVPMRDREWRKRWRPILLSEFEG